MKVCISKAYADAAFKWTSLYSSRYFSSHVPIKFISVNLFNITRHWIVLYVLELLTKNKHESYCYGPLKSNTKKRKWKRQKSDQNQIESRLTFTDFISHRTLINIILTKPIFAQYQNPILKPSNSKELRLFTIDTINYRFC